VYLENKTSDYISLLHMILWSWSRTYSDTELQYKYIKTRFFIEELINDKQLGVTNKAHVYMIRCIYGKPVSVGIVVDSKNYVYDPEWKPIVDLDPSLEKPEELSKMLEIAQILSKPFEFVRIDLYLAKDGIYFSEFTFTPSGGGRVFPMSVEMEMGKTWI
jgi:hypothetical protein